MPVCNAKVNKPMVLAGFIIFVSVAVIMFLLDNGAYYNLFAVVTAVCLLAACYVSSRQTKRAMRKCTLRWHAVVDGIEKTSKSTYLRLSYTAGGRPRKTKVRYGEKVFPGVHEQVGIYFNPLEPDVCMLAVYKDHPYGWTRQSGNPGKAFLGLYLFCTFFAAIGLALVLVVTYKSGEYTARASGLISGYESFYQAHTPDVPGTYEYTPTVVYELDSELHTAKSIESSLGHPYRVGDEVMVRYNPANPDVVIIEGFNASLIGGSAMFLLGIGCMAFFAMKQRKLKREGRLEPVDLTAIDFT